MVITDVVIILLFAAIIYLIWDSKKEKKQEPDKSVLMLAQGMEALRQQVTSQLEQGRQASEKATQSVFSQVQSFTRGMTELRETVHRVQESVKDVSSFQEMFRSPKLRGTWGELALEAILKEYFPRGGYQTQYKFSSGETVDVVLKLPNDLFLSIDSKFSWENFKKMIEAGDGTARQAYRKAFLSDVKNRIDEIATKYILPSEGTVDMALMYVPAESIYYEVIQNTKDEDVTEYARKRKVYITSPNTLYITLSAVIHWFKDVKLQKQTHSIMKKLEAVIKDAGVLATDFRKLGDHLSDAQSAFERSDKKLGHLVERTQKVIEAGEENKQIEN